MKFIQILTIAMYLNSVAQAASMRDTILISTAGGAMCKIYAEEVGGDVKAFSEMNTVVLKLAEKMGYLDDFQTYQAEVRQVKNILQDQLLQKHGSKLNIYNDWCIKFYNGFQNGIAKAYR